MQRNITKSLALLFLMLLPIGSALADDWYVRPEAQGAANGRDWNNAWSISGPTWQNVKPGDTIWLAGGTYSTGITVLANGKAGSPINILRATRSDRSATTAAGWKISFDSQVRLPGATGIEIANYSHIVIDGRTQYGILITMPFSGGYAVECDPGAGAGVPVTDLSFHNIDVLGPYASGSNPAKEESVGFKIDPSDGTLSYVLIDRCRIRGCPTGLHCLVSNLTIQYSTIQDVWPAWEGKNPDHPDVMYCYRSPNMTWRYNTIINCESDGIFFEFGGAQNFRFYGNVYYNTTNSLLTTKAPGTYGPMFVYNNVFAAPGEMNFGWITTNGSTVASGTEVYNNIFFNISNDIEHAASDYNAYNYTRLNGYSWPGPGGGGTEPHSITFKGVPFVNLPPHTQPVATIGDFRLTPAMQALFRNGRPINPDGFINFDMDGTERGTGGHWYIGAYQHAVTTALTVPLAPRRSAVSALFQPFGSPASGTR